MAGGPARSTHQNWSSRLTFTLATIGLPLGGLFASVFAGWVMSRVSIAEELGLNPDGAALKVWRALVRWLAPALIAIMIAAGVSG